MEKHLLVANKALRFLSSVLILGAVLLFAVETVNAQNSLSNQLETITEQEAAVKLIKELNLTDDPDLNFKEDAELIINLMSQKSRFLSLLKQVRKLLRGKVEERPNGSVVGGKGGATIMVNVVVSGAGPYRISAVRGGGAQYWTLRGEETHFVEGADTATPVLVEGIAQKPGIRRLLVSVPEGGSFGNAEMETQAGRSFLPPEGFKDVPLTRLRLHRWLARLLGKLNRLPVAKQDALEFEPAKPKDGLPPGFRRWEYQIRVDSDGAYRLQLAGGESLKGTRVDGNEVSTLLIPFPQPEGEDDASALWLALGKGPHSIEIPTGSSLPPKLTVSKLSESPEAYQELLKNEGFVFHDPSENVTRAEYNEVVRRIREIVYPDNAEKDQVEIFYVEKPIEGQDLLQRIWNFQFVDARASVSPVTPQ